MSLDPLSELQTPPASARRLVGAVLGLSRHATIALAVASVAVNVLVLTSPIYMLQVYDRVLSSYSLETLLFLTLITMGLLGVMTIIEHQRSQISLRLGMRFSNELAAKVFDASLRERLHGGERRRGLQDIEILRQFIAGGSITTFMDLPMAPLFVVIAALLSPLLGLLTLLAAITLGLLAVTSELTTRRVQGRAALLQAGALMSAETVLRNAQTIRALGMRRALRERWQEHSLEATRLQVIASDRTSALGASSRYVRIAIQSLVLGAGAFLVIRGAMTPGMMIAGAVLLGRGLAPIEQVVANWRGFLAARDAYARIEDLLRAHKETPHGIALPPPIGRLSLEAVTVAGNEEDQAILRSISFTVDPGQCLAVLGASGAGKSTLAKALVQAMPVRSGVVRLDGAALTDWPEERLGQHIGYLPQEIALLDGTVADNIARFQDVDSATIIQAAKEAGVHELILRLPRGYGTRVGEGGLLLSAGQRQRIALARALHGRPCLMVLDEPNSNLDAEGEAALAEALRGLKARGATTIIVSHRILPGLVDLAMVLVDGEIQMLGPLDQIAGHIRARTPTGGAHA